MKTDTQLQKDVMDEIKWEPSATAAQIGVSADNGVVTLNGTVATHAAKWAVVRAAQRVQGVKGIAEEITVKLNGVHARTDAEIAEAAVNSLRWHVWVPIDIKVTVAHGCITLKGEVNWEFQRNAAHDAVCFMPGVKAVLNEITVMPTAQPSAVEDAIEQALVPKRRSRRPERQGLGRRRHGDAVRQRPVVRREGRGRHGRLERPRSQRRAE